MSKRSIGEIPAFKVVRMYCDEGRSTAEVARDLGWSQSAVRSRLVQLGIERRVPWSRNAVAWDLDELRHLYIEERLPLSAIGAANGSEYS
jgi:transposase-like protein